MNILESFKGKKKKKKCLVVHHNLPGVSGGACMFVCLFDFVLFFVLFFVKCFWFCLFVCLFFCKCISNSSFYLFFTIKVTMNHSLLLAQSVY